MHPYKNRQTDRKWHFSKCIRSRTHTRRGNDTLANASIQEQTDGQKTKLEQKHPYKNRHTGRELHFNQCTLMKLHNVFQSQSSTPWTLLWAISLDRWTVTLQLRPSFHILLDHRTEQYPVDPVVSHLSGQMDCHPPAEAIFPRPTWSQNSQNRPWVKEQHFQKKHCYPWVLCNNTVVQEYYMIPKAYQGVMQHTVVQEYYMIPMVYQGVMQHTVVQEYYTIPMVYQGVMQHHCFPGVLQDTNGVPGCYATHCCPGVLHDTNGVPGCYATPLLSRSVTWYQWCYVIPLLSRSITQYQWYAMVLCSTTIVLEHCIPMVCQGVM